MKRRKQWLQTHPLCVMCQAKGRVTAATVPDHIKALVNGGADTEENLQSLCAPCHAIKTAADLGHQERAQFYADGRVVW